MSTRISEPSAWAERAARALSEAGYRRGGARQAILELLDEQTCALSAVEIEQALLQRKREVSRASVYRVMEELEEIGLVQRVEIGQGMVRYEPVRHGPGHHHHIVCDRCGRLEPFTRRCARAGDPPRRRALAARGLRARDRDSRRLRVLRAGLIAPLAPADQSPLRFVRQRPAVGRGVVGEQRGTVTRLQAARAHPADDRRQRRDGLFAVARRHRAAG